MMPLAERFKLPQRISLPQRIRLPWQWIVGLPLVALTAHIMATLLAVNDTGGSAYARLADTLKSNTMQILPVASPGAQLLPFLSPDARYALCRFTTQSGPVTVTAALPDLGWTLGVLRADGSSVYFAAAAPGRRTSVNLTIVPDNTRFLGLTPQALGQAIDANPQLTIPANDGVIVVRAPDRGVAYMQSTSEWLAQASCAPARS